MHLLKFALGIISLILAVLLAAYGYVAFHWRAWGSAIASWVPALLFFDLGLEWSFTKGMAPWWQNFPATDTQKVMADELAIHYPEGICRGEMSDLLFKAKHQGHIPDSTIADAKLCEVYSAANIQEAHLVKAALEDADIKVRILGDHLQNAVGDLPAVAIAPEVWVRAEDSEAARDIIVKIQQNLRKTKAAPAMQWKCNECGEINEPAFELCWNCQAAHDS